MWASYVNHARSLWTALPIIAAGEECCNATAAELSEKITYASSVISGNLKSLWWDRRHWNNNDGGLTYSLLIITIGSWNHRRNLALAEDKVKPIEIGFVRICGGYTIRDERWRAASTSTISAYRYQRLMAWNVYLQYVAGVGKDIPVAYWISRLACKEDWPTILGWGERAYLYTGLTLVVSSAVHFDGRKIEANGIRPEVSEESLQRSHLFRSSR